MEINQANDYIKSKIEGYCRDKVPDRPFTLKPDKILFLNKKEFEELNKGNLIFEFSFYKLKFAVLQLAEMFYLVIVGDKNVECNNEDFEIVNSTNQIFLAIVESLKLKIDDTRDPYEIIDNLSIYESSQNCELNLIEPCFEPFKIYKIPEEIGKSNNDLMLAIGKIIVSNESIRNLSFSKETIKIYNYYFDDNHFNYNIISSYASFCWRYCFLDIYRCLEPLFRHLSLPGLKSGLGISKSVDEISELLYQHCGWRPQEIGSMKSLFKEDGSIVSSGLIQEFRDIGLSQDPNENIGNIIYSLRNRIVHYQSSSQDIEGELTAQKWDSLIMCLLKALIELRTKYNCNI